MREFGDEDLPCFAPGDIAAIEQDIGFGGEVAGPCLQRLALGCQVACADLVAAQAQAAGAAVADDVDGREIIPLGELFADGSDAGLFAMDHAYRDIGWQTGEQALVVGNAGVDDEQDPWHTWRRNVRGGFCHGLGFLPLRLCLEVLVIVEILDGSHSGSAIEHQTGLQSQRRGSRAKMIFFVGHGHHLYQSNRVCLNQMAPLQ